MNEVMPVSCYIISLSDIIQANRDIFHRPEIINIYEMLSPARPDEVIDISFDIEDLDEDDSIYNTGYYNLMNMIKESNWYNPNIRILLDTST